MFALLVYTIVVALVSAFLLMLANKWGWIEWMQVHAPSDFLYRLVSCHLCLSFWMGLVVICGLLIATKGDPWLFAVPFLHVPLTIRLW